MKYDMFQYLLNHQDDGKIIIIENSVPNLDYRDANVKTFKDDWKNCRYGLLNQVFAYLDSEVCIIDEKQNH
jgi:hypothetical protein